MNKVINVEDNNYGFNNNKLIGALALKYTNPIVSVPFIKNRESESVIEELCKRTNLKRYDDDIYAGDTLITKDVQKSLICDELVSISLEDLNRDDKDLYLGNIVKNILKEQTVKQLNKNDYLLTEADLIRSLYGVEEEGSKSL